MGAWRKPERCTALGGFHSSFHGIFISFRELIARILYEITLLVELCFKPIAVVVARRLFMSCPLCGSGNQAELTAEMLIHFSGLKNLDKPGVLVVSKVLVCLDCGSSHFTVPKTELASMAKNTREDESSTLESSAGDVRLIGGITSQLAS